MNIRTLLVICLSILLASCETISFITLQIQRPGEVGLPSGITQIVVVDHAMAQPDDFGHTMTIFQQKQSNSSFDSEKLKNLFVDWLSNRINLNYSSKVYQQKVSTVKLYTDESTLTPKQIEEIVDSTHADLIISIDRLLNESSFKLGYMPVENLYRATLDGRNNLSVNLFSPKLQPIKIEQHDTLFWENYDFASDLAVSRFPAPATCLEDLMGYSADRLFKRIFPNHESVQRVIYTSINSDMSDAERYAKRNKWVEASYIWDFKFKTSKNERLKAYCAANMALYSEVFDQFDEAIRWAEISKSLFQKCKSIDMTTEEERIKQYVKDLNNRKAELQILEKQSEY